MLGSKRFMPSNRLFLPQETLTEWLDAERIGLDGEVMTLVPEGQRFHLKTAVHFIADLTESGDNQQVLGKVKDLDQLSALSGEHSMDSVIFGDDAYQVVEGFVAEPFVEDLAKTAATLPATPGDVDPLTRALMTSP